ncbi:hypothetical protein [Streptomyces antibioticus]|uniref:hypothetical protein n=1 Tax=Streptomyces antibioticus TaxID=1890 RepID=UPI0036FB202B
MSGRRPAPKRPHTPGLLLDWRHATVGDPKPCVLCGRPALMRDPDTGRPTHKVCAENQT